jgi:hypothetical protein
VRNRQLDASTPLAQVSIGRKDRRLLALGLQRCLACRKARDLALQSLQPMGAGDLR